MIEINEVRKKYASMPDSELIVFATEESNELTEEAFVLLKAEMAKRNLTPVIIEQSGNDENGLFINNEITNEWSEFIYHALEQKENGKTNMEIIAGLEERGLEGQAALNLLSGLKKIAMELLKKAEVEKLTGSFFFIGGIAFNLLPLPVTSNKLSYIIAWSAIIFGALRFIKGYFNKSRLKKVIINLDKENLE